MAFYVHEQQEGMVGDLEISEVTNGGLTYIPPFLDKQNLVFPPGFPKNPPESLSLFKENKDNKINLAEDGLSFAKK